MLVRLFSVEKITSLYICFNVVFSNSALHLTEDASVHLSLSPSPQQQQQQNQDNNNDKQQHQQPSSSPAAVTSVANGARYEVTYRGGPGGVSGANNNAGIMNSFLSCFKPFYSGIIKNKPAELENREGTTSIPLN